MMNLAVHWSYAGNPGDPDDWLDFSRVLYAYLHPRSHQPVYIGKADRSSVRARLHGGHKEGVYEFLNEQGITFVWAIVGLPLLPEGNRMSAELLSDAESLLISSLQPIANIQAIRSRISRPGLVVTCRGEWPVQRKRYVDNAA
jgi:hypothetical protein